MGLWLERYSDGKLASRVRFIEGSLQVGLDDGDISIDVKQAVMLAKESSSAQLEHRNWVLRIGFED